MECRKKPFFEVVAVRIGGILRHAIPEKIATALGKRLEVKNAKSEYPICVQNPGKPTEISSNN